MHVQLPDSLSALAAARARLGAVFADDEADASALRLLSELLAVGTGALRARTFALSEAQQEAYAAAVERRAKGEPVAYIAGRQAFWKHEFEVTPAVLVPRPDTELLVETALALLASQASARVLDACTGSGCVAISLAVDRPQDAVTGSDLSPAALEVARRNGEVLDAGVRWLEADGLQLPAETSRFHLITANPPYIAAGDAHLPALRHEPALALVSGTDGLDLIRALIVQAPERLEAGGWLLLEHGHDQGAAVRTLFTAQGFAAVETRRDLGGNERISFGRVP